MRWNLWRADDVGLVGSTPIADEAEQFLAGHYLDLAFALERDVPPWVWISALAHGEMVDLAMCESWLADHQGQRAEFDEWGRTLELLARQIRVTVATVGCSLRDLQQDLLLPTELVILVSPVGPATLHRIVHAALSEVVAKSRSESG